MCNRKYIFVLAQFEETLLKFFRLTQENDEKLNEAFE